VDVSGKRGRKNVVPKRSPSTEKERGAGVTPNPSRGDCHRRLGPKGSAFPTLTTKVNPWQWRETGNGADHKCVTAAVSQWRVAKEERTQGLWPTAKERVCIVGSGGVQKKAS